VRRAPSVTLERATSLPREAIIAGFPAVEHLVQLKIIQCAFRLRRCYGLEGLVHTTRLTRGSDLDVKGFIKLKFYRNLLIVY
jgi:primosomal replication protein N